MNETIKGRNDLKKIFEKEKDFSINSSNSMSLLIDLKSKSKMNYFSEKLEIYNFHSPIGIFFTLIISLIVGQIIYKLADNPMNFALKKYLSNKFIKN